MNQFCPLLSRALLLCLTTSCLAALPTGRKSFQELVRSRPHDPWPRGEGHMVLAMPGSPENWKGYHEPGGSFSPAFGSFGVSFWVVNREAKLLFTSDNLPSNVMTQRWDWPDKPSWPGKPDLPAIQTETPYYTAHWSVVDDAGFRLSLRTHGRETVWVMIRGPGPAGAPLSSLHRTGGKLYVSDRWVLTFSGQVTGVELAPPGRLDPVLQDVPEFSWPAEQPLGYCIYKLRPNENYSLWIEDSKQPPESPLPAPRIQGTLRLDLPDPRFVECLQAQVAQLLMGLVGDETRPGDPNHYPLPWLRDGAYAVTALERAGQHETARLLARHFAEKDFFGGFGAEADAPGLGLWVLDEVSAGDPAFASVWWPSVVRKVKLIEEMLDATGPVRRPFAGPVVPRHTNRLDLDLVCEAAKEGLIQGRMDWHRPVLFVNAVTYRGLIGAVAIAERLGRKAEAEQWRARALALRRAWNAALAGPEAANERTRVCGFHPTFVVQDRERYGEILEASWSQAHDAAGARSRRPEWTYFTLAEAHQWLGMGRPERALSEWEWFWRNQASPALYCWWEGTGEENTFHRWEQVWGWANPPHVTPHYWTAAEMLLLQLDMLTMLDESGPEPRLIIGAGIPADWVESPLRVETVRTRLGKAAWQWNRKRLTVEWDGPELEVQAGGGFPAGVEIRVKR